MDKNGKIPPEERPYTATGDDILEMREPSALALSAEGISVHPNLAAMRELQKAFAGEAERVGWSSEEDVVSYCREIRREMWEECCGHTEILTISEFMKKYGVNTCPQRHGVPRQQ